MISGIEEPFNNAPCLTHEDAIFFRHQNQEEGEDNRNDDDHPDDEEGNDAGNRGDERHEEEVHRYY